MTEAHTVSILGENFRIRGDAAEGYIAEVARAVDLRMREIQGAQRNLDRFRLAVLTAINLADELMQKNTKPETESDQEYAKRTRQLIDLLDEGLVGEKLAG